MGKESVNGAVDRLGVGHAQGVEENNGSNNGAQEENGLVNEVKNLAKNSRSVWAEAVTGRGSDNTHTGSTWFTPSAVGKFKELSLTVEQAALRLYTNSNDKRDVKIALIAQSLSDETFDRQEARGPQAAAKGLLEQILKGDKRGTATQGTLLDQCLGAHLINARMSDLDSAITDTKLQQMHCRSTLNKELSKYKTKNKTLAKVMGQGVGSIQDGLTLNKAISTAVRRELTRDKSSLVERLDVLVGQLQNPTTNTSDESAKEAAVNALREIAALGKLAALASTPKELRENQALFANLLKLSSSESPEKNKVIGIDATADRLIETTDNVQDTKKALEQSLLSLRSHIQNLEKVDENTSKEHWEIEGKSHRSTLERLKKSRLGKLLFPIKIVTETLSFLARNSGAFQSELDRRKNKDAAQSTSVFHPLPKPAVTEAFEEIDQADLVSLVAGSSDTPNPDAANSETETASKELIDQLKKSIQYWIDDHKQQLDTLRPEISLSRGNTQDNEVQAQRAAFGELAKELRGFEELEKKLEAGLTQSDTQRVLERFSKSNFS